MRKWRESHALSHSPSSSRVEREGIFSAFPMRPSKGSSLTAKTTSLGSTTDLQIATKKKYFYYLTTDNDIQMCLTSQSESQSESRQLRLHVHHSRAG